MKSILLISRCPPYPTWLGDRLIIWHLARELHQRQYQIDLIAFKNRPEDGEEIEQYQAYFRNIHLIEEPRRSKLSYLGRILRPGTRFPHSAESSWSPEAWQIIQATLQQQNYDLVHLFGGVQVYEYAKLVSDFPTVITPYESFSLLLRRRIALQGGLNNRIQQWVASKYESWMFTPYDRVVVVAGPDQNELLRLNPSLNINVISNGIDLDAFRFAPTNREPFTVLFTGNYEYPPNVDAARYLIERTFPQIQAQIPAARLLIVGNAPPPELTNLQNESIEITGRVPEIQPYLEKAAVFVSPLRIGAGIKNKVLEALASGIPVVATPLSVDGIHVQHMHSAIIAEPDQLAAATVELLQNPELQQKLALNGRKLIEKVYSWKTVADKYEQIYAEITDLNTAPK